VLKAGTPEHARVICRLNHVPAFSMAQTINQLLRGEGQLPPSGERAEKAATARSVVLVPESIGNRLLIAGPPDAVEEVRRLIEELDQPPGMLVLEVVLGEAPVSQEKPAGSRKSERKPSSAGPAAQVRVVERPPQMETIGRGRLTTMDNQPAQIQIGTRVPGFRGASAPSSPGQAGQMSLENVGLTLAVTPRIIPGAVVMEIDVTQSQLGPENESVTVGIAGNQLVRSAKIDTTMAQTTVRIRDGESMVLGSIARAGKPDKELLIVVTPHIVEVGGAKQ
jgi:type II secretory pathway component GspD/PulD (secretin)